MVKRPSLRAGFTLFEVTLALIIAALVGLVALRQISDGATKRSGDLYGTQLNEVRKALDKYVEAYQAEIIANDKQIQTSSRNSRGSLISIPISSTANCDNANYSVRCPTLESLVYLKLLPAGYLSTSSTTVNRIRICGFDPSSTTASTIASQCEPIFSGNSNCSGNSCSINGFAFYPRPFKLPGDADDVAAYHGDLVMHILGMTEGRGAFTNTRLTSMRRQGDAPSFVPNPRSDAPSGMVAAVFGTVFNTQRGPGRENVDYCPAKAVRVTATSSDLPGAKVLDSQGNNVAFGSIEFANFDPCNFGGTCGTSSNNGNNAGNGNNNSGGGAGVSCNDMAFVYPLVPVGTTTGGSGYTVGSKANNTGTMLVSCSRDNSGIAKPSYQIYSCK